jgi:hypothetical protein
MKNNPTKEAEVLKTFNLQYEDVAPEIIKVTVHKSSN